MEMGRPMSLKDVDSDVLGKMTGDSLSYLVPRIQNFVSLQYEPQKDPFPNIGDHQRYDPANPGVFVQYEVSDEDLKHNYDMNSFPRGVCVIFNMCSFTEDTGLMDHPRTGTEKDATDVKELFLRLGFVVYVFNDITKKDLLKALEQLSKTHSSLRCFTCVILSHGTEGHIFASDTLVKLTETFSMLKNPLWVGKPKLFFIQACQGSEHMEGMEPDGLDQVDAPVFAGEASVPLPSESDFLFAYSTPSGFASWRSSSKGSWFIQEMCESFYKYSHKLDLGRILTRANDAIALRVTRTQKEEMDNKRQIASVVSQLRKDLYFLPPYGPLNKT